MFYGIYFAQNCLQSMKAQQAGSFVIKKIIIKTKIVRDQNEKEKHLVMYKKNMRLQKIPKLGLKIDTSVLFITKKNVCRVYLFLKIF